MDEFFLRYSTNLWKYSVGIDANQLYPLSMCQARPIGFYTRWEIDSKSGEFKLRRNRVRSFENMVMSHFQRLRQQCKMESFYMTSTQKN